MPFQKKIATCLRLKYNIMNLRIKKYQQALAHLTINSSLLENLGLFHGKMGIVLFFSHYARITQSEYYADLAGLLLDEIYEEIHQDLPINLENGLCGIGWGIEYLIQYDFMEGDTDKILAYIDRKVMEINPLIIHDLSIRNGLAGIVFYVTARLNAKRHNNILPFDNTYLVLLNKAIIYATQSTNKNEIPSELIISFNRVLKGEKIKLSFPFCSNDSHHTFKKSIYDMPLGLENGLAGWLWNSNVVYPPSINLRTKHKKSIFFFDEENRSTKYGIGTYNDQLLNVLSHTKWQIIRIRLFAEIKEAITIKKDENTIYINIAIFHNRKYKFNDILKRYYQGVFFILYPYLNDCKSCIFHLNTMQCKALGAQLKYYFPQSSLLLTVHYTNWSFALLGNQEKMKAILNSPKQQRKHPQIYKSFKTEKQLMQLCDRIIAIAKHSYDDIINLYQVPKEKIILIPHGLPDAYCPLSTSERIQRRKKYGFSNNEQILIFAGRIDPIKGVEYLAETFTLLAKQYPNLRLIIAGDGNLDHLFNLLNPIWSKTICTGFIDKSTLYELFSISDIGILPSLHEEFGYVALEMMMMKLPIIAGKTTGLSELINDGASGLLISLQGENKESIIVSLQEAIIKLLTNRKQRTQFAQKGRDLFLEKYNLPIFQEKMRSLYEKCFIKQMIQQSIHIN